MDKGETFSQKVKSMDFNAKFIDGEKPEKGRNQMVSSLSFHSGLDDDIDYNTDLQNTWYIGLDLAGDVIQISRR